MTLSLYGEPTAIALASFWTEKMTYLFEVWVARGVGDHRFTQEEVAGFNEPESFRELYASATDRIKARVVQLRAMRPSDPR